MLLTGGAYCFKMMKWVTEMMKVGEIGKDIKLIAKFTEMMNVTFIRCKL